MNKVENKINGAIFQEHYQSHGNDRAPRC